MKTNISQYLSTKTNQEISENVAKKLDLNKQSLTWYNKAPIRIYQILLTIS